MLGHRIVVEYKESKKESKSSKNGPTKDDLCYNCGRRGHWANECTRESWKNRCYRCGKTGHIKKECP